MGINNYLKTLKWYDDNAQIYTQKSRSNVLIDIQQLKDFCKLVKNGKILDAGCGSGRDTNLFTQYGFDTVGVDISKKLLECAKKDFPNANFLYGNLLSLPFKDNFFDGIWAHASIVHFEENKQIIRSLTEFSRVLKTNGFLHLLVRAQKNNKSKLILTDSISNSERFYRSFTKEEIKTILVNLSFNIKEIIQYNESDIDPNKRPGEGIEWILVIANKK